MAAWVDALLPTFALIALGGFLRWRLLPDMAIWAGMEALTFWVLLPALLAAAISTIDLATLPLGGMAGAIWIAVAAATASAIGLARALRHDHAALTSVVQGGVRFNNFVAFSIVGGLYGVPGVALGGVAAGLIVPVVQVTITLVFALGGGRRFDPLRLGRQLVTNPLLIGCAVGYAFALSGGMPPGLGPLAKLLGQAAVVLGLLCVGAALSLGALREAPLTQILVGAQKLVAVPLVTLAGARLVGLDPLPTAVAVMVMATPTAPTSYVMARAMGGDARLMAAMISLQHLASVATLPLWALWLARSL
jgi:predicted permease